MLNGRRANTTIETSFTAVSGPLEVYASLAGAWHTDYITLRHNVSNEKVSKGAALAS